MIFRRGKFMPRNVILLNEAIDLISATISLAEENKRESPYFIIEGAGISCPEIPVASEIIDQCKKIVKQRYSANDAGYTRLVAESDSLLSKGMKYYSFWIEKAFPNKADRSNYFKGLITNSKISAATLLLAQIVYSKRIITTVFTTNFDENLEKALNLFGTEELFIADNPRDNLALEVDSPTIQVAHLHGTYRFYDCANLESEIQEVTSSSDFTSAAFALRTFLLAKAPIIIGYSGWEGDVIMNCIEERIQHSIPYNYFWICYCKEDYNRIPEKLKQNNSIFFVVPENEKTSQLTDDVVNIDFQIDQSQTPLIPATLFFGKLVSKLGIASPTLLSNPSIYFSELIKKTLPDNDDVFHLKKWAERMGAKGASESASEKNIHLLELASAKKDFTSAKDLINILAADTTLGTSDYLYILQSLILQLAQQEEVMTDITMILGLREASLKFITDHKKELCESDAYAAVLERMTYTSVTYFQNYEERFVNILQSIFVLLEGDKKRDGIRLRVLRGLSIFATQEDQLNWLNILIKATEDTKKQNQIKYYRCVALLDRVDYVALYESKAKDIRAAMKLAKELDNASLIMRALLAQVKLGSICEDMQEKKRLQSKALNLALKFNHDDMRAEKLKIVRYFIESNEDQDLLDKKDVESVFDFMNFMDQVNLKTSSEIIDYAGALKSIMLWMNDGKDFARICDKVLSLEHLIIEDKFEIYIRTKAISLYYVIQNAQTGISADKFLDYVKQLKILSLNEIIGVELYYEVLMGINNNDLILALKNGGFEDDLLNASATIKEE